MTKNINRAFLYFILEFYADATTTSNVTNSNTIASASNGIIYQTFFKLSSLHL